MKKIMLTISCLISANSAFACNLSTPIPLHGLELDKREIFNNAKTTPHVGNIIGFRHFGQNANMTLNLSHVARAGSLTQTIGARVSFEDTVHSAGVSDNYINGKLETKTVRVGESLVHTVKSFSDTYLNGKPVEYYPEQSEVVVVNNMVVSVKVTTAVVKRDANYHALDIKYETACVNAINLL
ncbi:MAG: hypothetical protein H0V66_06775 [Bdellovibrionales bacterium]|nr:hypothetical protein [Bdellovibrionales bacterium]